MLFSAAGYNFISSSTYRFLNRVNYCREYFVFSLIYFKTLYMYTISTFLCYLYVLKLVLRKVLVKNYGKLFSTGCLKSLNQYFVLIGRRVLTLTGWVEMIISWVVFRDGLRSKWRQNYQNSLFRFNSIL